MNTKLTLSIEASVIERAKAYAKEQGRSLSNVVEEYLKSISTKTDEHTDDELHPLVQELYGALKIDVPEGKSYRDLMGDAMMERYLKR